MSLDQMLDEVINKIQGYCQQKCHRLPSRRRTCRQCAKFDQTVTEVMRKYGMI